MGITGKFAMPFLSTLAALVIIVHSTEEDTESGYRTDLRPRILDTGTPTYDQPWRVVDQETMIQKSTQSEAWNDYSSSEEPPKRRRYGRKRKRRPQPSLNEDQDPQIPQNRYRFPEEPLRPYFEVEVPSARQTTEVQLKRRRKKLDGRPDGWTEEPLELERPLRRRGQRRKRPSLEAWPELSEFNGYRIEDRKEATTEKDTQTNNDDIYSEQKTYKIEQIFSNKTNENEDITKHTLLEEESDIQSSDITNGFTLPPQENDYELLMNKPELQEDKSLSEFSIEVMTHAHEPQVNEGIAKLPTKMSEKISGVLNEQDKSMDKVSFHDTIKCISDYSSGVIIPIAPYPDVEVNYETLKLNMALYKALEKDHDPIDPVTLKDILKRSNGSSLSEILQQNNLTLADLLRGKENAISILKSESTYEYRRKPIPDILVETGKDEEINVNEANSRYNEEQEETENGSKQLLYTVTNKTIDLIPQNTNSELSSFFYESKDADKETNVTPIATTTEKPEIATQKIMTRVRFPTGLRKKLRMRPLMNTTYKAQLSRDLIALNARKYIHHRRNNTKSKEWKNILPSLPNNTLQQVEKTQVNENTEINYALEDTTTPENVGVNLFSAFSNNITKDAELEIASFNSEITTQESTTTNVKVMEILTNLTAEKIKIPEQKQAGAMPGNRRHPFNRKKKRVRQKVSTTESSRGHIVNNYLGKDHFEISRPLNPIMIEDAEAFPTNLEDFMTTRPPNIQINATRSAKSTTPFSTTRHSTTQSTTEESARIEIDEILNDTGASARLSKILVERNMTLSELVEHRERGSSHVHLADIFHNASKEPNPPEPFLSKSLIEPISKETYPLRAILEANLHDANVKATTIIDPSMIENNYIPVVMNFGNNVNENAENMGIMSLFSNFTRFNVNNNKNTNTAKSFTQLQNLEDKTETTTEMNNSSSNMRESRVLSDVVSHNNHDDVTSWNEIFSLMKKNYMNETKDLLESYHEEAPSAGVKKIIVEEDIDGEGVIVLEDLQHLRDFDNNIASLGDEKLEFNSMERTDAPGILQTFPSQTKSVTVATASIAGLAIILFLLTYAAFKWKQQRGISGHKNNFSEERVPTPVFESRKGHKNNSSNRSISPMLSTSNIYTLNTLDSRNGKESPEYMWDTLRKPFQ